MTARLVRLRIAGFKSFAEPVSLDILPGLTGIVGPNGCGKSNVADALRWAMGETSARSLRGGEMDDVIFAGTTARASRNLAEVSVSLEAGETPLPAPFDQEAELQVTRRIERGAGSTFRANGRELRARDVQTLYADLASGARSSGMVSQGRVAALVGARPEERRQVLEEAAGIAGLHARRHEAELKLRAAEQNLGRADDSRVQLDAAREGLRRQARQAARYRAISDLIRAAEAEHMAVLHGRAAAAHDRARTGLDAAQAALVAAEQERDTAGAALADAEAALPQPRQREAEARSVLERRRVEADSLAEQAQRAQAEHAAASDRLQHLAHDLEATTRALADAQDSVARLAGECARLDAQLVALPAEIDAATRTARAAQHALDECQNAADMAAADASEAARRLAEADHVLRHAASRASELRARHGEAEAELASATRLRVPEHALDEARMRQAQAQADFDNARARLEAAEAARTEASSRAAETAARAAHQHALRSHADEAARTSAARLALAEAAWSEAAARLAALNVEHVDGERVSAAEWMADAAEAALAEVEERVDAAGHAAGFARAEAADARRAAEADMAAGRAAGAAYDVAALRRSRLSDQLAEAQGALASAQALPPTAAVSEAASVALAAADHARVNAEELARQAGAAATAAGEAASRSRTKLAELGVQAARLSAEAAGLAAAFGPEQQDGALSGLNAPPGLEAAIGAALGEAAQSSLDPERSVFWRALDPIPAPSTPAGTVPLAGTVQAPGALSRALSHAVLLDEAGDGDAVQAQLAPGMVAVSRDGGCWRWDGHVTRAGAPNLAAARLLARSRLDGVSAALRAAQAAEADEEAVCAAQAGLAIVAEGKAAQARAHAEQAGQHYAEAVAAVEAWHLAARRRDEQVATLAHAVQRLQDELDEAERHAAETQAACALIRQPDPVKLAELDAAAAAAEAALDAARTERLACRSRALDIRRAAQALAGEAARTRALIEAAAVNAERAADGRDAARQALEEADAELAAMPDLAALDALCARLADAERACREEEEAARTARAAAEAALEPARRTAAELQLLQSETEARWSWLTDLCARAAAERQAGERACAEAERARGDLPDAAALHVAAQDARDRLDVSRQSAAQAHVAASALEAALAHAGRTAPSLAAERLAWQSRLEEAVLRHDTLTDRHASALAECAALAARPADLTVQAARVHQAHAAATATHQTAEAALEAAHGRLRALAGAERDAAREAGARGEALARAQAMVDAAATQIGVVSARVTERLGGGARLPDAPDLSDAALEKAARRTERLARERDEMGPVNLRAELEMAELDEKLTALARDQEELTTAIAKLRGAIGHLNREGRERLQSVFAQVDQHFRSLFTRMMGGGQAHLAWTGSDDPLEAGLDIFAEPPGKKLTSLSLLSGGEQALTALSLIFAVFRCTPAPLCVLDEVDAPLDDANVDRFCTLLDEMSRETGTSFLVVTHHQLTMSRMDRLYGVTMQERGVSRLLSVALSRAVALAEPVRVAAE